jgi:dipeptidyl aminopeptidase/acylaminoacyl peptidase
MRSDRRAPAGAMIITMALLIGLAAARASVAGKRALELDDFDRLQDVSDPVFAPKGDAIVYTVSTHNTDSDATVSDLWRVSWKGGDAVRLTQTPFASEWHPQWKPDGSAIAFLSDRGEDETTQIWLLPSGGGDAQQVTHVTAGVSDFVWSPDGTRMVFVADDEQPAAAKDSRGKDKPAPPIVTTRFQFKEDTRDYLTDRRAHLYLLELSGGAVSLLTGGSYDEAMPAWSPDGQWISFVSKRSGDPDRNMDFDIFVMPPVAGAPARKVSTVVGSDNDPYWESRPSWSPDSRRLVWLTSGEDKWVAYLPQQLSVLDVASGRITTPARIDRWFYKPRWSSDGRFIDVLIEQNRNTWLARVDPASGEVRYLTHGKRFAYDFASAPDGRLLVLDSDDVTPPELTALENLEGREPARRALTSQNAFLANVDVRALEDFEYTSEGERIEGMLLEPPGFRKGVRYPLIVRLHGGPVYQFSHEFFFEWQFYASQGYLVAAINPRGSSGRGFDFARAIYANWGVPDVKDVIAGVDYLIRQGSVDPQRIGAGGRSYGGILTDYVIASDKRFKAAVSGAGMGNMLSSYGHDMYIREMELEVGLPWKEKDFDTYVKLSYPFLHADRIVTPTLFYCAGSDFNVPCIGSEQMYQALRSRNVPTELVVYPGENHGMTVPSYLRHRLTSSLEWYDRYLKPAGAAGSASPGTKRQRD